MTTITLHYDIEPKAKQSARHCVRGGKVHSYQKGDVIDFENNIAWLTKKQLPEGFQMFEKFVRVDKLHFAFQPLKGFNKQQKVWIEEGKPIPKNTKPDLPDNLSKAVFDALSKLVYVDDSLIFQMDNVAKFYSKNPYIEIVLTGE